MPPNLPNVSVCSPWAATTDITEADSTKIAELNQTDLEACLLAASNVLHRLSGRQFAGEYTDYVRPNARMVSRDHGRPIATPVAWTLSGNGWGFYSGAYLGGQYSRWGWALCNQEELPDGLTIPSVDLGTYPVTGIIEIKIDGQVVDPTTYRVDGFRHLVRVINPALSPTDVPPPGFGWPCTQRMELPDTEVNTWSVRYTYGTPPPPDGKLAAAELGYQLYLATHPSAKGNPGSRLPKRVTQIAREGITAVVLDPQVFLKDGRTGLILCDYFLMSVNPGQLRRRATMWSPDLKKRVRRPGPVGG